MQYLIKRILISIITLGLLTSISVVAQAEDGKNLPAEKQTKLGLYFTPQEAYDYVQKNMSKTLFVDIRTPAELTFLGTAPSIDTHVPYELMDTKQWNDKKSEYRVFVNPDFVADITERMKKKGLGKDDAIILMCRSGNRSSAGANLLAAAGYTKVYNQFEGYEGDKAKEGPTKGKRTVNGWKNAGLPWTYHMDKDVMYLTR